MAPRKNPAAVALGRMRQKKRKLTSEEARRIQLLSARKRKENRQRVVDSDAA